MVRILVESRQPQSEPHSVDPLLPAAVEIKLIIKLTRELDTIIRTDLDRPHEFSAERVGFVSSAHTEINRDTFLIILKTYHPVADDNYVRDNSVGARINGNAIRAAMQH